jgi:hypothetical protein
MFPSGAINGAHTTSYKDQTPFVVCIASLIEDSTSGMQAHMLPFNVSSRWQTIMAKLAQEMANSGWKIETP